MPKVVAAVVTGLAVLAVIVSLAAQSATKPSRDAKPATQPSGDFPPATKPTSADAKRFVGMWRTVSPTSFGFIHYDALGYMTVQVASTRARRPFAGPEPTGEEAKEAIRTYHAYWGPFTVDERARTVTHHRVGHVNPSLLGDFVRRYEFLPGDRLALEPVEPHTGDRRIWERIKPSN